MIQSIRLGRCLWLALFTLLSGAALLAETLYQIPVEHNHRSGECQGTLIIRDDKIVFESRNQGCGRVIHYENIDKLEFDRAHEFHLFFSDSQHGKGQKYVLKFKNDQPVNKEAVDYILFRMGKGGDPRGAGQPARTELSFPYRFAVELDLNGSNCRGHLVLREDKIIFENNTGECADRAFVRDWDSLMEYRRLSGNEFMLIFYKYGASTPDETTRLRFFATGGDIPPEVHRYLIGRNR